MFTSNYARVKRLPPELRPVAISVGPPRWWKGEQEPRLCPTRAMLKMSRENYDLEFDKILAQLDPRSVYEDLGPNAVMLCWEAPNVSCHRRRVAEWFEQHLGIVVPEFGFQRSESLPYADMPWKEAAPKPAKKLGPTQLFLL